ncbi:MAG: DUF364 domain-containing protein [Deltaproteobacteria bacterium]|nr:DUF364 domain-containing protein [Deltaproteobacteria bacterium]
MPQGELPGSQATIASRIIAILSDSNPEAEVLEVRIGLGYTAVRLTDNRLGVAFTFHKEALGGCSVFHGLRPLSGRKACELVALLDSTDPIEAGVGLACVNALVNQPTKEFLEGDILDQLLLKPQDQVGMVGYFGPLVEPLRKRVGSLTVFERIKEPNGFLRPVDEANELLPECQVALITATSIINHSIDDLLKVCRNCREVAILGASAPLLPKVFEDTPVSFLSGVVVTNPAKILQIVSEGGGMRFFKPHINKVNLNLLNN